MSLLPNPARVFDITPSDKSEKHDSNHYEHVEDAAATIDLLCSVESPPQSPQSPQTVLVLPLSQLLPQDFRDYYDERAYESEEDMRRGCRPRYTQRNLIDWDRNDVRSLLFVHELNPKWEGQTPIVSEEAYRVILLPLDSSDVQMMKTLVDSDLYKEHCVSRTDREAIARVVVEVARNGAPESQPLSLPEWRHMIENYLLNLGCEVQTRHDYRVLVNQLKASKKERHGPAAALSVEERIAVWKSCQQSLYRRLRLDWRPDEF